MVTNLHLVIAGVLGLAACSAPSGAVNHKDDMNTSALAIDLRVTGNGTPALTVHCAARNVSGHPLHVFDSPRMP
jgi:hypothetical protein